MTHTYGIFPHECEKSMKIECTAKNKSECQMMHNSSLAYNCPLFFLFRSNEKEIILGQLFMIVSVFVSCQQRSAPTVSKLH